MDAVVSEYACQKDIGVICITQQGESHIRYNVPCQDYSGFRFIRDGVLVAAIADGLGACKEAEVAAKTAVKHSLDFFAEISHSSIWGLPEVGEDEVISLLHQMMKSTVDSIHRKAVEKRESTEEFLTTLSVVVYYEDIVYFAHIGDDGIVVQKRDGTVKLITERHKGEDLNSVMPLQAQDYWQFGKVDDVVSIIMATDGILDQFVRSKYEDNRVYYPFIEPLITSSMNEKIDSICRDWSELFQGELIRKAVYDDITFLGIVNIAQLKNSEVVRFDIEKWNKDSDFYSNRRNLFLGKE